MPPPLPILNILTHLGLQDIMHEIPRDGFKVYVPHDYEGSDRQSMDEVYRMGELVLLHVASGLRFEYLSSESYYGDEMRYRFRSVFVKTVSGEKLEVTSVDFEREIIHASVRGIRFNEVSRDV